MNEQRGDFVERVKDQAVPPHSNGYRVVAISETVGGDEEAFRMRECPDRKKHEQIDEIAQVGQKVVVAFLVVGDVTDGHEVCELNRKPVVEVFRSRADQVAGDEDVEYCRDEGDFFPYCNVRGIGPSFAEVIDRFLHATAVFVELFVCRRDALPPFFHRAIFRIAAHRPYTFLLALDLVFLC